MARRIVAGLFTSLDGIADNPGMWSMPYFNDQVGQIIGSAMQDADCMLLGRQTYEEWAGYWPGKTAADDPFADYINTVRKYVVSTTLHEPLSWQNSQLFTGTDQVEKLKQEEGKDIAISGSLTLVGSLLTAGLLDELSLLVSPIAIGSGKRLFDGKQRVPLTLLESRTLDNGVLHLRYAPDKGR
jgi:dihydrofolate reductase